MRLIILEMKMKMKNKSHRYDINRPIGLDMDANIVNIYRIYLLNNTRKQHLKLNSGPKLSNTEKQHCLQKSVLLLLLICLLTYLPSIFY